MEGSAPCAARARARRVGSGGMEKLKVGSSVAVALGGREKVETFMGGGVKEGEKVKEREKVSEALGRGGGRGEGVL